MLLSAHEVSSIVQRAVREAARKLEIDHVDYVPAAELLPQIKAQDENAYAVVVRFVNAYQCWFRLAERLEMTHPGGAKEDPQAAAALMTTMKERDDSRSAFVAWLTT